MPIHSEASSTTRVFRPRMEEAGKPLSERAADKLANAIRKSWIQERSNGTVSNKRT